MQVQRQKIATKLNFARFWPTLTNQISQPMLAKSWKSKVGKVQTFWKGQTNLKKSTNFLVIRRFFQNSELYLRFSMFSKEAVKCKYQSAMYSICSVSDNVIGDCDRWMDLICLNIVGSSTMLFSIGRQVQYMYVSC